jgi:hypothetical protein
MLEVNELNMPPCSVQVKIIVEIRPISIFIPKKFLTKFQTDRVEHFECAGSLL